MTPLLVGLWMTWYLNFNSTHSWPHSPQVDVHLVPGRLHIRESQTSIGPLMEALERLLRDEMTFGLMPQQVWPLWTGVESWCAGWSHIWHLKNFRVKFGARDYHNYINYSFCHGFLPGNLNSTFQHWRCPPRILIEKGEPLCQRAGITAKIAGPRYSHSLAWKWTTWISSHDSAARTSVWWSWSLHIAIHLVVWSCSIGVRRCTSYSCLQD